VLEEEPVYSGKVGRMSLAKAIDANRCQDGVSAPAVLGAWFPAYQPLTLKATD